MKAYIDIQMDKKEATELFEAYSIDTLVFRRADGTTFNIDFEEADYDLKEDLLYTRLKSLGCSYVDQWEEDLGCSYDDVENNVGLFKDSTLVEVCVYFDKDDKDVTSNVLENIDFSVKEVSLLVGEETIKYDVDKIAVI